MSDHPSTIEGALKWADVSRECGLGEPCMSDIAVQTLAAAYREVKAELDRRDKEISDYYASVEKALGPAK
jgi:hypothetical protein